MEERQARYRLGLFTWIFISFFLGSLALLGLIGVVTLHAADNSALDVAQQEMTRAVALAARGLGDPHSEATFIGTTAPYRRGLVLYEPGPLTFTLVDLDGRIDFTTPRSLDGQQISDQSLAAFRSKPRGSTILYLPLRHSRYILAWQKIRSGYLSALAPQGPLLAAMYRNLVLDLGYALPLGLIVTIVTSLVVGVLLSRSARRLRLVRDEESAAAFSRRTHVRELAEVGNKWGEVLRRERQNALGLSRAFAWRDRLTTWLAAASARPDQDLASVAQAFVGQLPFPIAQLSVADPQRNVSYPLAWRGYGSLSARELTQPLDPPTGLVSNAYMEKRTISYPQDREMATVGMPEQLSAAAAVAVPLPSDGEVRGVLAVAVREAADLPLEAVQSLEQIAPLLGALIARQDALDRLRRQDRLFTWMREMNPLLMAGPMHNADAWWPQVERALREIAGARAAVVLQRLDGAWQTTGAFGPGTPQQFAGTPLRDWVARLEREPEQFLGWHEQGALCFGGVGDEALDGVILLLVPPEPERIVLLRTIFEYLATANEVSVRRQTIEDLARMDPLTGVLNFQAISERFDELVETRGTGALRFVLLDLDGFQAVNKRNGRSVGDLALAQYGQHLKAALRQGDSVGRVGGDEFVLLLQGTEDLSPGRLGEFLSASVGAASLEASHGLVLVPEEAATFADAYRLADQRMHERKQVRREAAAGEDAQGDPAS